MIYMDGRFDQIFLCSASWEGTKRYAFTSLRIKKSSSLNKFRLWIWIIKWLTHKTLVTPSEHLLWGGRGKTWGRNIFQSIYKSPIPSTFELPCVPQLAFQSFLGSDPSPGEKRGAVIAIQWSYEKMWNTPPPSYFMRSQLWHCPCLQ